MTQVPAVPRAVAPSRNCTVPDAADGVTVAVNVTVAPPRAGFRDDATLTLAAAFVIVSVSAAEVLVLFPPSPL